MKLIIAGSRSITDPFWISEAYNASPFNGTATEIVSGGAFGIDRLGEEWAKALDIPVTKFMAKWSKYGRGAGLVRNQQMGWYADALLAIWDSKSTGTKHMIDFMRRLKKPVFIYEPNQHPER